MFRKTMEGVGINQIFDGSSYSQKGVENWTLHLRRWPRDNEIRRGLLSSWWTDVLAMVQSKDEAVFDGQGAGVPARDFLSRIDDEDDGLLQAAVLGPGSRRRLQTGIPAPGTPRFGGDSERKTVAKKV